jgi:hypothetical protein
MNRTAKTPDGGPTSQDTAARTVGGRTTHARGNVAPRNAQVRYEKTDRPDGMPLPQNVAPEAHGGHYYTPEDREKYKEVIGYDKGLAPGYDPVREKLGGDDERGKYEVKPWKSPAGEEGNALVKMNFDGSRSIRSILAVDPQGNLVELAPNTVALKQGWKFAAVGDINAKTKAAEDLNAKDEEARKAAAKAAPPAPPVAPVIQSQETPEARKAREEADPALQALRNGTSKTTAERIDQSTKPVDDASRPVESKDRK